MRAAAVLLVAFVCSFASVRQPLDCSDWAHYGRGCHARTGRRIPPQPIPNLHYEVAAFDMAQRLIRVRNITVPAPAGCLYMGRLNRHRGPTDRTRVIASLPPRCNGGTFEWADAAPIWFDLSSGTPPSPQPTWLWPFDQQYLGLAAGWVAAIHGYDDVLGTDTYTPLPPHPAI
jgi:hypothetical protein